VAHHEDLRGLVIDWGGVLTNSIRTTVKAWVEAEGIDWASYVACMRPWLTEAYGGPDAAGNPVHALERGDCSVPEFEQLFAAQLTLTDGGPVPAEGLLGRMFAASETVPAMYELLRTARAAGVRANDDVSGPELDGATIPPATIHDGQRWSASRGYLQRRRNLTVVTKAEVRRVILRDGRAIGVEYRRRGRVQQAFADNEVVVSAGAYRTPHLLQLSGIGPGALLQQHGIAVVHDLPGVGENLQDHCGGRIIYRCTANVWTMNEVYHNWLRRVHHGLQYVLAMKGALMTGAGPMGLFVRTRPELASPDVQYQFLAGSAEKTGDAMHRFPGCTLVAIPCRPESRAPRSDRATTG